MSEGRETGGGPRPRPAAKQRGGAGGVGGPEEREGREGLHSIGEVARRLEQEFPDVTPSSLRFFESEGLVVPRRTPGGHRLYGEEEIERLRRIRRWQRDERLSLAAVRERLAEGDRMPAPAGLARAFLREALAGRGEAARALPVGAHAAGMPLGVLFRQVLEPALEEIGRRWQAGRLAVSQEHEVSAIARDVVAELAARSVRQLGEEAGTGGAAVAACAPGERHDLGLRMVAAELQELGHRVHFLGADVPVDALVQAVRARRPALVLLSVSRDEHVPGLEEAMAAVRAIREVRASGTGRGGEARPRVVVGGRAAVANAARLRARGAEVADRDTPVSALVTDRAH